MLRQVRAFRSRIAVSVLLLLAAMSVLFFVNGAQPYFAMHPLHLIWVGSGLMTLVFGIWFVLRRGSPGFLACSTVIVAAVAVSWLTYRVIEGPSNRVTLHNLTGQVLADFWLTYEPTSVDPFPGPPNRPIWHTRGFAAGREVTLLLRMWTLNTTWAWAGVLEDGTFVCGHSKHWQTRDVELRVVRLRDDGIAWWLLQSAEPSVPWPTEE